MTSAPEYKRLRAGSMSGRLRTVSDLEETGMIDRDQKGVIKDLIISGDFVLQSALDKYEKGETAELEELIRQGIFNRRQSIDLLEGLDLDFLNQNSLTEANDFEEDELFLGENQGDFSSEFFKQQSNAHDNHASTQYARLQSDVLQYHNDDFARDRDWGRFSGRPRNSSVDSTCSMGSFQMFDMSGSGYMLGEESGFSARKGLLVSGDKTSRKKNDQQYQNGEIDMRAYTAVAASLQANSGSHGGHGQAGSSAGNFRGSSSGQDSSTNNRLGTLSSSSSGMLLDGGLIMSSSLLTNSRSGIGTATKHSHHIDDGDQKGFVGAYSAEQRRARIDKFLEKRNKRVWSKKVKYDVRKNFADSRLRVKGRFVKKEDENIMRELLSI